VLEHVSGGELFDYLVKKGRLTPKELQISHWLIFLSLTIQELLFFAAILNSNQLIVGFRRRGDSSGKLFPPWTFATVIPFGKIYNSVEVGSLFF
jgi:hypothetical protein